MNVDNLSTITVLSLCSGYGGLELGLSRALANPLRIIAVEIEAYALANLEAKAAEGRLAVEALWPDLRTFPAERFRGCFDIVIAGFPCQPFSVAGQQRGGADERHLWPHIERIIGAVEPFWVFLENVPGLLFTWTLDNRPDLREHLAALAEAEGGFTGRTRWYLMEHRRRLKSRWLREKGVPAYAGVYFSLRDMGYSVEAGLFTAAECGAPHKRERLFVLAHAGCDGGTGRRITGDMADPAGEVERNGEERQRLWDSVGNGGSVVADSGCAELAGRHGKPRDDGLELSPVAGSRDLWPAGPGQQQYDWEEPRVIVGHTSRHDERGDSVPRTHGQGQSAGGPSGAMGDPERDGRRRHQPGREQEGRVAAGRPGEGQAE